MKKALLFLVLSFFSTFTFSIPPSQLAASYTYNDANLCPDGTKLAINAWVEGRGRIIILDLATFKPVGVIMFQNNAHPGETFWVNNERIVTQVLQSRPWLEAPQYYGELYAANYDGKRGLMIYGVRVDDRSTGSRLNKKKATRGWATVLHRLPDDERKILISSEGFTSDGSARATVHKLDVYSGKMSNSIALAPIPGVDFITDKDGEVMLAYGEAEDGYLSVYARDVEANTWTLFENDVLGSSFQPFTIDEDNKHLFVGDIGPSGKSGLFKLNLESQEVTHIYTDEKVSMTNVTYNTDKTGIYAMRVDDGRPAYVLIGSKDEEADVFKNVIQSFPGNVVSLMSRDKKGDKWVIRVDSDISPGTFYLFDKKANQIQFLFRNLEQISIDAMSEASPFTFTASDGLEISAFLNRPVNLKEGEKAPLVTLVHGGPHFVRDYWTFDREVQMLTTQGYAVLRVNFRGSGGYGNAFRIAGHEEWGGKIQQDIIDGIKHVAKRDDIDAEKICIMGGSFGAYSAVMSATLEPDLFKCVVANAGLYDLELMYEEGDIPERLYGKNYLERTLGTDDDKLKRFSPINHIDKIQAPILIAHGKKDERTPFVHAENLRDKLEEHNKEYEWFIRDTEAHGFFDEENRTAYFEEVASFLKKHLK